MKCVYCDKVKPEPTTQVFTEVVEYAQVSYAVCLDCMIDNCEVDRNTL
jgi:hypothetical protein